jgi:hypothetical protein
MKITCIKFKYMSYLYRMDLKFLFNGFRLSFLFLFLKRTTERNMIETGAIEDQRFLLLLNKKRGGNKETKMDTLYEWLSQNVSSSRVSV